MSRESYDTIVIGGGVLGTCVAYGLARAGERVCVIDEDDQVSRASRGNFGLVWVQGKGTGHVPYARWTMAAAATWPSFAAELLDLTGIDVDLSQPGGMTICLEESELAARVSLLGLLRRTLGNEYPFTVLDHASLKREIPKIASDVAGAVYCPLDGHVSPLKLLRALFAACRSLGVRLVTGVKINSLSHRAGGFSVHAASGPIAGAGRLVLAAGLGNCSLAPLVGLEAPVIPIRGQIVVTERVPPFLNHPTLHLRQTSEGVLQIGDSKEDVGYDDGTTREQLAQIALRAVRCFPSLAQINVVRAWGALRVMTRDGLPVYEESADCPGAFLVTCHSGITLAPQHAGPISDWIRGGRSPAEIAGFRSGRFHVQTH